MKTLYVSVWAFPTGPAVGQLYDGVVELCPGVGMLFGGGPGGGIRGKLV